MSKKDSYTSAVPQLLDDLQTNKSRGLSHKQVEERLETIGPNKLPDNSGHSVFSLFIGQFQDFMVLVLIAAVIISGFLGEYADAIAILSIVILNAIMGFVQEFRAEKSLQALKELTAPKARVLREGEIEEVVSEELVPGDIIFIEIGDKIPVDARIIESSTLEVNESSLTGESLPVVKKKCNLTSDLEVAVGDRTNMIHMGTVVTKGRCKAVVTETGLDTEMGQIASLLHEAEDSTTPLQERLEDLGKGIVLICLLACAAVVALGVVKGEPLYKMFLSGVSLAVAAIPEGLPAIVTLALAIGVQRMIKRNAIVRKLPAVETLGCATVICSDKTGTLTKNEMTVQKVYTNAKLYDCKEEEFNEKSLIKALEIGAICNNAKLKRKDSLNKKFKDNSYRSRSKREIIGEPTEGALILAADDAGIDKEELDNNFSKRIEIPFDSSRKRMSVIVEDNKKYTLYIKGAPDILLKRCTRYLEDGKVKSLGEAKRRAILRENENLANQALRILAVGYRELSGKPNEDNLERYEDEIVFVGLIGMIDPPRPEVADAIRLCKQAGIKPKMVTGDHKNTAAAIAERLNLLELGDKIITGQELMELTDKELERDIDDISVFARVSPQDKLRIVKVLQRKGHIVAMTGDGVNDAPAIKEADIGIAMGQKGTDVTQEASALILADDNFATIVAAVEEGRGIYDNIRKFIRYLLSCNVGEILTMFLSSLLGLPLPLIPIQILWVNLVTDGLPALALGIDPADDDIMEKEPRPREESIFAGGLKWRICGQGILIGFGTLLVFLFGLRYSNSLETARTMAFTNLVMAQLFFVFSCRSEKYSVLQINPFTNIYLLLAVVFSFGMHLMVLYLPMFQSLFKTTLLAKGEWAFVLLVSGGSTLLIEFIQFCINLYKNDVGVVNVEESLR
ncbi:Ca2+-transporting ATPase [Orenia metallireducens]|uniref:P-type Ca(2+) transporter n=1 Tax=Orenia metallireducens TaxID=1413210 RepID=A0A285FD47_9FIRM|nr:calcium-transporting P-type ATPase, PMR1-type [Orenia metallireducens]PRX33486.1 Ca2+-transporting ATPase [Orenia metallireducens]SNY09235.1 Ca2+-transporting ATPase [Orenia metallireducens]